MSDEPEETDKSIAAKLQRLQRYAVDNADRLNMTPGEARETVDRLEGLIRGQRYASLAREQINPLQEMLGGFLLTLTGDAAGAAAVINDAGMRMAAGEPFGELLTPPRVSAGRADALAGKPPEAPDVGYLASYCDMLIEMEDPAPPAPSRKD